MHRCCKLLLSIAGLAILLTACSSDPGYFQAVPPSNSLKSVLYLYRPKADNPGLQPLRYSYPDIILDGNHIGQLKFNTHFFTEINPGTHHIKVTGLTQEAKWEARDIEQDFVVAPNETKYLKLDVQFNTREMNIGQPDAAYIIYLTPISAEDAIYEIRHTKLTN